MTHYYVCDINNRPLSDALASAAAAHDEGAEIRERTGVNTFVRSGSWSSWTGKPTERCMGQRERSAATEAAFARIETLGDE